MKKWFSGVLGHCGHAVSILVLDLAYAEMVLGVLGRYGYAAAKTSLASVEGHDLEIRNNNADSGDAHRMAESVLCLACWARCHTQ